MSPPDQSTTDGSTDGGTSTNDDVEWFAESSIRLAIAVIGFVLLLFALGQAVGLDLLGLLAEALSTWVGRWLAVAFFALLLIVVALRGLGPSGD